MNDLNDLWDAIIIGAGPAGGASAILLAQRGWRVLLVERSGWPRDKACGGCLNAAAVANLRQLGLAPVLQSHASLSHFRLTSGERHLDLLIPPGIAIARDQLDPAIVAHAIACGVTFLPATSAKLLRATDDSFRLVQLSTQAASIRARLVLACDGLAGTSLDDEPWSTWRIARNSWFGVSTMLPPQASLDPHTIHMFVGRAGYVGLVQLHDGRVHLGAALSPAACRGHGPAAVLAQLLCNDSADLRDAKLLGTPLLTRCRTTLGGHRVLAVGDACGYVEPFTGQGIAWALASATEAANMLPQILQHWPADLAARWTARHRAAIARQQITCKCLRALAHRPILASAAFTLARLLPAFATRAAGHLTAPLAV